MENVFDQKQGLNFTFFKNLFFPWQTIGGDAPSPTKAQARSKISKAESLKKLDFDLRTRFNNDFRSVKKAFLQLDADRNGLIDGLDIMRLYGTQMDFDFSELVELVKSKGKSGSKKGTICFADFCKWLGNTINPPEGLYFRHDSKVNPPFILN